MQAYLQQRQLASARVQLLSPGPQEQQQTGQRGTSQQTHRLLLLLLLLVLPHRSHHVRPRRQRSRIGLCGARCMT